MSELQDAIERSEADYARTEDGDLLWEVTEDQALFYEAARRVANGTEIRYCLWHERRAADDSGDEDSGAIVTRFCSSQNGSHDCVIETRLLLGITTEDDDVGLGGERMDYGPQIITEDDNEQRD